MKTTRKSVLALIGAMAMGVAAAAPSVEITSVQQQYPWTNTVDITYVVSGVTNSEYFVKFTPLTSDNKEIPDVNGQYNIQVALTNSGTYTAQWYPQTNQQYTACKMVPAVYRGAAKDYMIVDLVAGGVSYEPMATQEASNQRYNTDEYKTRKLVLRRIPAATYHVGEDGNTADIGNAPNTGHDVVAHQDFYVAIFALTEAQYGYIVDGKPPTSYLRGPKYPKVNISYNTIRGSALTLATPNTGLFKKLSDNAKGFDLPTCAMYEIAARAGLTTKYISGNKYDEKALGVYGVLGGNYSAVQEVGTRRANNWGFYDVIGNIWEFCRDAAGKLNLKDYQTDALVPVSVGSTIEIKNCARHAAEAYSPFAARQTNLGKTKTWDHVGFRVAFIAQ